MRSRRRTEERKAALGKPKVKPGRALHVRDLLAAAEEEPPAARLIDDSTPVTLPVATVPDHPATPETGNAWISDSRPAPGTTAATALENSDEQAPILLKPRNISSRRGIAGLRTVEEVQVAAPVARLELPDDSESTHATPSPEMVADPLASPLIEHKDFEEQWASSPAISGRTITKLTFGITLLLAASLALVLGLATLRHRDGSGWLGFPDLEVEASETQLDGRFALMTEDPLALKKEAVRLLEGYSAARNPRAAEAFIRPGSGGSRMEHAWKPWASLPQLGHPDLMEFTFTDTQEPPFMTMRGIRADFSPFCAYFVRDQGQLRLDWEATEARCDIPIAELPAASEVADAVVRCEIESTHFYTAAFPESAYRSYSLNSADYVHWVCGYVDRDSDIDRRLRELLNDATEILEHKQRERVTLRVTAPPSRNRPHQFRITEILCDEWLLP